MGGDPERLEDAMQELCYAVAKAWCVAKFPYSYGTEQEALQRIEYDAKGTMNEQWLVQAVEGFIAGISHVPVKSAQYVLCEWCRVEQHPENLELKS